MYRVCKTPAEFWGWGSMIFDPLPGSLKMYRVPNTPAEPLVLYPITSLLPQPHHQLFNTCR